LTVTLRGSAAAGFPESWTTEVSFDPTGAVYNQWGLPVAGATVSLLREDQGEFKLAPAAAINPGQNNPQTTTTDGVFLWDPMPGNYKIIAQAPNATVDKELAEMSMPPNRTGLIITMNVAGAQPPQPAQKPTFTSPQAGAAVKLDPIIWPDGLNVIEEVITWQVDGVPLLFGHNINLPVHLGGQRLTASIRAHVTRQKNFSGIAPQLATGTRENHNFTSFTYEIDAGTIAADPTWQAVISIPPPGTEEPSQPAATPSANSTIQAPKTPIKKLVKTPKPKIKGKLKVGQKLKVTPGKWDSGVKLSYRWYLSGKAIKGATKTSLKLTSKMVGKRLTIKVTGKRSGYQSITKVSAKTAKVKRK
jgi:hypothetical protein